MPRRPALITQADIARALRAVKAAGIDARVEITPDGKIVIIQDDGASTGRQSRVDPNKVPVF